MSRGKLILVAGLSGCGKSILAKKIIYNLSGLKYFKTVTTRQPRDEQEKADSFEYSFVSEAEYESLRVKSSLWDHSEIYGNFYGVDVLSARTQIKRGQDFILNIFPDPVLQRQFESFYYCRVVSILMDVDLRIVSERLSQGRPPKELARIRENGKQLERVMAFSSCADCVFKPVGNIELDSVALSSLLRRILAE